MQWLRFIASGSRRSAIILCLLALPLQTSTPQDRLLPVIHFNRLTTADGLPTNEIRSNVVRDRQGFIWVGTEYGLARYDGYTCKVYHEFKTPNNPLVLFIDSKGRFWIGKYANGLSLYDAVKDRFITFHGRRDDSLSLDASYIQTIYEDQDGCLWLGTEDDVVSVDLGNARDETNADSVARHARFRTIPFDGFKDGTTKVDRWDDTSIVVASFGGLFVVDRRTGRISRPDLHTAEGVDLAAAPVHALLRENPGKLWIGTFSHGLYLLNQVSGHLTGYPKKVKEGAGKTVNRIQELQQDRSGTIWIATGEGVDRFDPGRGTYEDYVPNSLAPGKSHYSRMSLDSTGTLWISTDDDGLFYLSPASFRFPHFALRGPSGRPMEMETINRWSDGSYWIAAEGKVTQIRPDDLKVLRVVDLFNGEKSGFGPAVWTSLDDGEGTLWYGTWGLGLYSFEPQTGLVKNYRYSRQLANLAFKDDICRSIVSRERHTLWIAAFNDKLLSFDTRRHTFASIPHDLRGQIVHLMKDQSGKIWISDLFLGLFVADPSAQWPVFLENDSTGSDLPRDVHVEMSYQDPGGGIWIGGTGLYRWEPESRSLDPVLNEKFKDPIVVRPLGSDSRGRLWVNYVGKGLGILDPHTNTFANFDDSDGLFTPANMSSLPDGRVMLVGARGMIIVHPDSLNKATRAPLLVLSRVSVNDTMNVAPQSHASTLELRHDQNVLEFEFAAIDPGVGHLIEYLYRLEGLEDSWIHPSSRRFVRYPGLAPGKYVFRVKAMSKFGRWPDREAAVAFSIAPPWWNSLWFRILVIGSMLGLLGFVYRREVARRHRDRALQEEFSRQQIESQEIERKHLASELHDGLGQDLLVMSNEIQRFLQQTDEPAEQLHGVASLLQESIEEIREISSSLHPHLLDRLGFCEAVSAMAERISHSTGLVIDQSCSDVDRLLSGGKELHVYRIIQEALSNVARHAGATRARLEVTRKSDEITVIIADDGKGFEVNRFLDRLPPLTPSGVSHGFGLSSMQERARILGGSLKFDSSPGSGTTILVTIPLQ